MRLTRSLLVGSSAALALLTSAALADPGGGKGNGGGNDGSAAHGGGGGAQKGGGGPKGGGGGQKAQGGSPQQKRENGNGNQGGGKAGGTSMRHQSADSDRGGGKDKGNGNGNAGAKPLKSSSHTAGAPDRGPGTQNRDGNKNNGNAGKDTLGTAKRVENVRLAGRTLRNDLRQERFKGSGGRDFVVPVNDRVRVVTSRQSFDWGRLDDRVTYRGCPPGLAKKNNGCTPPGQDRAVSYGWFEPDWYASRYYRRGDDYRYYDGYLLRAGGGSILSYIPLLGGALAIGSIWPGAYEPMALPPYYGDYYDLGPATGYRYYDDTIYRVDPDNSEITGIAALLTGNDFLVGEPMPMGYDVYNVPWDYRDQYVDGPDAWYRYDDGTIYQVDPTSRLIEAAIQLLS